MASRREDGRPSLSVEAAGAPPLIPSAEKVELSTGDEAQNVGVRQVRKSMESLNLHNYLSTRYGSQTQIQLDPRTGLEAGNG